jgi:alkylated DNA repair dioxygenase AlkB
MIPPADTRSAGFDSPGDRGEQAELFGIAGFAAPPGFRYAENFLAPEIERELLERIGRLPLEHARHKQWSAKRRILSYGAGYDFERNELTPAPALPPFLAELRAAVATFAAAPASAFGHAMIAEYAPGTGLGWHRDVPQFEKVIGISLGGHARFRLRRYPHVPGRRERPLALSLAPRSVYCLEGEARWGWQHAVSPTRERRYSITFRTLRAGASTRR